VSGPATVVQAVAQGNAVARAVDRYLRTGRRERVVTRPGYEVVEQRFDLEAYAEASRAVPPAVPVDRRAGNFGEVEQALSEQAAQEECRRCLRCDLEWLQQQGRARPIRPAAPAVAPEGR